MRIAYLVNQYPTVTHIFIRREIRALERRGVEVVRLALRGWDSEIVDAEDEFERAQTRYVLQEGAKPLLVALIRVLFTRPICFVRAFALACRVSRKGERPFPVHFVYLAEACRVAIWLRLARIQHLHTHFGTNSAEVAMLTHALGGPTWSFTIHGPKEFDKVESIGLPEKVRRAAFVVAISSYGRAQLYRFVERQNWPKIHVVHCGLETAYWTSLVNVLPDADRLVCVGRLCEQKGQILLVEAARQLRDRGVKFELVLVGDGEMRADIEAAIGLNNLQSLVRITGRISSKRLHEEILGARALVLPSFAEGLPMVIMEAMALRRPVITTFVAGIPELVLSGENGWLVPAGNVKALTHAMETCLNMPVDVLRRMGEAAHARVLTRHNVDTQAAKLIELFRAVIAQNASARF